MSSDSVRPAERRSHEDTAAFARMVVWLLRTQAVLVVLAALAGIWRGGTHGALAVVAGGGIGIVLTAVAALRTGSGFGSVAAMVAAFYRGMALKLVLAVALFVAVALWFAEWFVPVLAGYVVTLVAYWIALIRVGSQQRGDTSGNNS